MKKISTITFCLLSAAVSFAQHENHQPKVDSNKIATKPKSPKMVKI